MSCAGITKVQIYNELGCYNLFDLNEKSWQLVIHTWYEGGRTTITETFPEEDGEPDWMYPTEALDLIAERLESYWISTRRDAAREKIALLREALPEIEQVFAHQKIAELEEALEEWQTHLEVVSE
jgi:hypothetical protein